MKKYNIFNLCVITIKDDKYICEPTIFERKYKEIFTGKIITLKDDYNIERLTNYYSLFESVDLTKNKPLLVSKENLLNKYIRINKVSGEYGYYKEKTELYNLISLAVEDRDKFFKSIGENLTPEERAHITALIKKNCYTCNNGCCQIEEYEKPVEDCIGWENNRIVGEYKVLKLNRINR